VRALAAIGTQLTSLIGKPTFNSVSYFSYFCYFTIDSNLIAAALLLACAARWLSARSQRVDLLRGAGVVYMAVTGIVAVSVLMAAVCAVVVWLGNTRNASAAAGQSTAVLD
jgi:hypothetical protein